MAKICALDTSLTFTFICIFTHSLPSAFNPISILIHSSCFECQYAIYQRSLLRWHFHKKEIQWYETANKLNGISQ